jgi:diguanylate cyclase (GGDEF)-like protein
VTEGSARALPRRRSPRISLQAKILALVLLCVGLPLVLSGIFFLRSKHELLSQRGHEVLANGVYRKAAEVDVWARQRQEEAQRWAASFVVFEGLEALARHDTDATQVKAELTAFLVALLPYHQAYESLFIVDLHGRVLAATREEPLGSWVSGLVEPGPLSSAVFSPVLWAPDQGRPEWLLVQPVNGRGRNDQLLGRRGQVLGYIVGRLDLRELERLLVNDSDGLAYWMLDSDGRVLVRTGRIAVNSATPEYFPASLEQAAPGTPKVHEGQIPGIGAVLFSLRSLEGPLRASVATTLPTADAYRPLVEARNRLLVGAFGGTVVLLLLAFFAARRVLRPILRLSEAARQVSAGELDVRLPVRGRDEISDLTTAFNEMAQRVRDARARVEETRDDLARANQELTEANRTLETLAITDGLTGLYNRRHFQDMLEREIARCQRENKPLTLLLCDLDNFKAYNDRWGHQEGDAALRRVSSALLNSIRASDTAFRYGGEELAVLLPACAKDQASEVAEKIRLAVRGPQDGRMLTFRAKTTISIGVASFPDDARVARGLIDMADAALYAAKDQGRDRVVAAIGGTPPEPQSSTG